MFGGKYLTGGKYAGLLSDEMITFVSNNRGTIEASIFPRERQSGDVPPKLYGAKFNLVSYDAHGDEVMAVLSGGIQSARDENTSIFKDPYIYSEDSVKSVWMLGKTKD